jgi:phosphatidylserine/phosphatidylglycerophosphate/cardiolipin synthase-like enzyme
MSDALRTLLVSGLAEHMRGLSESRARDLALELTSQVNMEIARLPGAALQLPCFPRETWNVLTIGVPWEAYSHSHGVLTTQPTNYSPAKALCSAPAHMDGLLAGQAVGSGLWGGSLLVALGTILGGVERDLLIFAPYWRTDGVRSLLAAAGRKSYCGVTVRVYTQPSAKMNAHDQAGLSFFVDTMKAGGASVRVIAPAAVDGMSPFLHAKLIIADAAKAYVGSANFTNSGLDHGIEAGVLVEGEVANAFARWANVIEFACRPW